MLIIGGDGVIDRAFARRMAPDASVVRDWQQLRDATALDRVFQAPHEQLVVTTPLAAEAGGWVVERVDGPRWVILSIGEDCATTAWSRTAARRAARALSRGATVVTTATVFGMGLDTCISPLIRTVARLPVCPVPATAANVVQPLHVDDVIDLVAAIGSRPQSGHFSATGPEAVPASEVIQTIAEIVGTRRMYVQAGSELLRILMAATPAFRILARRDTANAVRASEAFGWCPRPLGVRLEQAACEALPTEGHAS